MCVRYEGRSVGSRLVRGHRAAVETHFCSHEHDKMWAVLQHRNEHRSPTPARNFVSADKAELWSALPESREGLLANGYDKKD